MGYALGVRRGTGALGTISMVGRRDTFIESQCEEDGELHRAVQDSRWWVGGWGAQ